MAAPGVSCSDGSFQRVQVGKGVEETSVENPEQHCLGQETEVNTDMISQVEGETTPPWSSSQTPGSPG